MNDLTFALRQLRKNPGFTALLMMTLALGIGANTAIFSFLDRMFLRTLPVRNPHGLVALTHRSARGYEGDAFIYPFYLEFRAQAHDIFSELVAHSPALAVLDHGNWMRQVPIMAVSSDYFNALGIRPALGRSFRPDEDQIPGAHPVVILSYDLWRRQFDRDPAMVGATIRLNEHSLTVIGIAPSGFTGTAPGLGPAVYLPLATWAHIKGLSLEKREYDWLHLLGRLKEGVGREQARAALQVLIERIHAVEPVNTPAEIFVTDGSRGINVWTGRGQWFIFALVQTVAALILFVACANVVNLMLARGVTRQKEMAIRVAIGANRMHLIRQLLAESLLLALFSGSAGVILAHWLTGALRSALPIAGLANIPFGVDGRILVFGLSISLATALACGLVPALRSSRPNLQAALNETSTVLDACARRWRPLNFMVVLQVTLAMVVLAFSSVCVRSLERLWAADPGFDAARILVVSFDTKRSHPSDLGQRFKEVRDRVATYPGVRGTALAESVPLAMGTGRNKTGVVRMEDFEMPPDQEALSLDFSRVSPGYFRTLGVPLLQGRDFTSNDRFGAPGVMIVNELFAHRFWPGQNPVGKRVTFQKSGDYGGEVREVVGVVRTAKLNAVAVEPFPLMFWPIDQPMRGFSAGNLKPVLLVRTAGDPKVVAALVRKELESARLDPIAIDARTLRERLSEVYTPQRLLAGILSVGGLVAVLFVATGIFGMMAYEVSQRTREIGIRVALGAGQGDVRALVLRNAARLTLAGLALGTGLSLIPIWLLLASIPEVRHFLYGVHAWDPLPYIGAALGVVLVALAACWVPAHRASRVDPTVALRYE